MKLLRGTLVFHERLGLGVIREDEVDLNLERNVVAVDFLFQNETMYIIKTFLEIVVPNEELKKIFFTAAKKCCKDME